MSARSCPWRWPKTGPCDRHRQLAREADRLLVEDTRFWVVSARVSGSAVSGLGTLLSGAYVGMDVGKSDQPGAISGARRGTGHHTSTFPGAAFSAAGADPRFDRRRHAGVFPPHRPARSPVSHWTIQGKHIDIQIFIKAPYDRFVTTDSRFWNASGVDVKLGADGVQVNTESLTSILAGGLAFQTPETPSMRRRRRTTISICSQPAAKRSSSPHATCSTICCASPSRCAACRWARRSTSAASRSAR
jgi:hypothetical protein